MHILVIGGGGREHALAWKLAQSPRVSRVSVAPGNAGTATEGVIQNVAIAATDLSALLAFAQETDVALTVVGPEAPLVAGLVDAFEAAGLACFGPRQAAAQLEGSKAFSKAFLERHGIPTAAYASFTEVEAAIAYIRAQGAPIVVKADGLAAGKGVILAQTEAEAIAAVTTMLSDNQFGDAGHRVVVEEFLRGEEASFIVMVDGTDILPLASSQDHKAAYDGDQGPNTGGMGAYSPAPVVDQEIHDRIMTEVIRPTIAGLVADGLYYRGFLYAGIMVTADGTPKVLEFNCRFGDPETQPILMRLKTDLVDLIDAACTGRLGQSIATWDTRAAVGVVLAAPGYPGDYPTGAPITLGEDSVDTQVFHAGTQCLDGQTVTSGGRVLCVTALGATVREAQQRAYARLDRIQFEGAQCRRDIGYRAIMREQ
jgi:phosphoribosylamine---glycine ligase